MARCGRLSQHALGTHSAPPPHIPQQGRVDPSHESLPGQSVKSETRRSMHTHTHKYSIEQCGRAPLGSSVRSARISLSARLSDHPRSCPGVQRRRRVLVCVCIPTPRRCAGRNVAEPSRGGNDPLRLANGRRSAAGSQPGCHEIHHMTRGGKGKPRHKKRCETIGGVPLKFS